MKSYLYIMASACLLLAVPVWAENSNAEAKANASSLLTSAQKALGQVVRTARKDPGLDGSKAEAKPFWDALKQLNEALGKAETGLTLKDDTFFSQLAVARGQVIQADIALGMNGAGGAELTNQMATLDSLVTRLDENFSKEAASLNAGKPLTADEQQKLKKLQAQQTQLLAKLDEVEKNAAKNNKEMQAGIEKIRQESKKIRKASRNRAGFVSGFIAARMMSYWMWGWHWWWGPWGGWCPGYIDVIVIDWGGWIDAVPYDWDLVDAYVDISDLDLGDLSMSEAEFADAESYLVDGDFGLDEGDLQEITQDLDLGWDDVQSDVGREIEAQTMENFDSAPYDDGYDGNTFDDHGMDDFGGDFGGGMDFGGSDDW